MFTVARCFRVTHHSFYFLVINVQSTVCLRTRLFDHWKPFNNPRLLCYNWVLGCTASFSFFKSWANWDLDVEWGHGPTVLQYLTRSWCNTVICLWGILGYVLAWFTQGRVSKASPHTASASCQGRNTVPTGMCCLPLTGHEPYSATATLSSPQ